MKMDDPCIMIISCIYVYNIKALMLTTHHYHYITECTRSTIQNKIKPNGILYAFGLFRSQNGNGRFRSRNRLLQTPGSEWYGLALAAQTNNTKVYLGTVPKAYGTVTLRTQSEYTTTNILVSLPSFSLSPYS